MKTRLKLGKKSPCEINWRIREIFSEAALASFCDEINTLWRLINKIRL